MGTMIMRFSQVLTGLLATSLWLGPAMAQDDGQNSPQTGETVSATDAAGVMAVLKNGGYEDLEYQPASGPDEAATIKLVSQGLSSFIIFDDCQEAVAQFCETLVLSTAWDRKSPMSDQAIAEANRRFRYISVWKDDEGDPFAQWSVVTKRQGIPAPVFLDALARYLDVVYDFWDVALDADDADEISANRDTDTPDAAAQLALAS